MHHVFLFQLESLHLETAYVQIKLIIQVILRKFSFFFFLVFAESQNIFCALRNDWGFSHFMPLSEVYNSSEGFLVNDTLIIEADVTVLRFSDWSYEDRKETGLAALKSRVVDCYQDWTARLAYFMKVLNRMIPPLLDGICQCFER